MKYNCTRYSLGISRLPATPEMKMSVNKIENVKKDMVNVNILMKCGKNPTAGLDLPLFLSTPQCSPPKKPSVCS